MTTRSLPSGLPTSPIVHWLACGLFLSIGWTAFPVCGQTPAAHPLRWEFKLLCVDANEGIDLADVNRDGKLDVIAGRNWFAAPEFAARPLRKIDDWNGYVESNGDFAYDVDRDGWVDVIAGSFLPTAVHWYRNPGTDGLQRGQLWEQRLLMETGASQNEAQLLSDLDSDGMPEWVVNSWNGANPLVVWKLEPTATPASGEAPEPPLSPRKLLLGPQGQAHGLGVGDLDDDGDRDVLVGNGWYEHPGGELKGPWTFHQDWEIQASIPMLVSDLDRDGRSDIIVGKGHDFGLQWWRQLPPAADGRRQWEKKTIDDRFSQPHALLLVDLNGDGSAELITGKRWYAHNGGDPGGQEPPCLYYYAWDGASFTRHVIDEGHIGTGSQIRTGDLNGDGRADSAVAGKSGTYLVLSQPSTEEKGDGN
ncbi:MAG: FG-GAP repeat domain-containing protein [Planctomycetota bacterium]